MDDLVNEIDIAGRKIGTDHGCFIIAEAGVNHNGDLAMARQLVAAAAQAGAEAVKFQTFSADRVASVAALKADYQLQHTAAEESQHEMLRQLELSREAHLELMAEAKQQGILFLSTPFDEASADLLEELDLPAFKIASGELTNLPFLAHVARKGRPLLVSTGMATLPEVQAAVDTIRHNGNPPLALLHCVSNYPAQTADVNLRAMETLWETFAVPVGYSDHTDGRLVPAAAATLGAAILEKHLTLDRQMPGPDHQASLEPQEFKMLVEEVRTIETALGDGRKQPVAAEMAMRTVARRSLFLKRAVVVGAMIRAEDLIALRPGNGISPLELERVVGRRAAQTLPAGHGLAWNDLV